MCCAQAPLALAPKNPNWDLKRDLARELELLELRTQQAVIELIRDKLRRSAADATADSAAAGDGHALNEAIDAQVRAAELDVDE